MALTGERFPQVDLPLDYNSLSTALFEALQRTGYIILAPLR